MATCYELRFIFKLLITNSKGELVIGKAGIDEVLALHQGDVVIDVHECRSVRQLHVYIREITRIVVIEAEWARAVLHVGIHGVDVGDCTNVNTEITQLACPAGREVVLRTDAEAFRRGPEVAVKSHVSGVGQLTPHLRAAADLKTTPVVARGDTREGSQFGVCCRYSCNS